MHQDPLSYEAPQAGHEPSRVWGFLAGCALVAPFLTVPTFVLGAGLSQDYLISGDGLSWLRATLYFGIPTGLITIVALAAAIRTVARRAPRQGAAIFAVVANTLTLGFIVYAILDTVP